ncbi:MAG: hypothetical protein ACI8X5_001548 [Planctomycetota bacterium]|jgi:hypothetical protein
MDQEITLMSSWWRRCAVAALLIGYSVTSAAQDLPEKPARRRAIDGIASIYSHSTLEFPSAPDTKYECEATFVFPDRARWRIGLNSDESDYRARSIRFHWGAGLWLTDMNKRNSVEMSEDARRTTLMQLELRRVAMIWPAELEWKTDGDLRIAQLPGLGSLHAQIDPKSKRPIQIESHWLDGKLNERLDKIAWRAEKEQFWPASWELVYGGKIAWKETFDKVQSGGKFLETYFIPIDRRTQGGTTTVRATGPQPFSMPKTCVWSKELSEAAQKSWEVALVEARAAIEQCQADAEGQHLTIDARPGFNLNSKALPTNVELRLKSMPEEVPKGWSVQGEVSGLRMISTGTGELTEASIQKLREQLPPGSKAGKPYAIVQLTDQGSGITQILLPFSAKK